MTQAGSVSIIIVSRGRPYALRRCLNAVSRLFHPCFEIVVVADPAGCSAIDALGLADRIKTVLFDDANIAAARNLGMAQAACDVVAFIDDDAVPEPTWADHLAAPFTNPKVAAAGGFVRGRNGISWQSQAATVDAIGQNHPIALESDTPKLLTPPEGCAIRTEGTNMAFRRSTLVALGGFDPAFRFYLEETDLNLRMAAAGHATAIVPLAQVHHGFAASPRRRCDRVPVDLFEIGASWAVFLRRHCPEHQIPEAWQRVVRRERRRAVSHMVSGGLEPRDVRRLLKGLHDGYRDGIQRPVGQFPDPVMFADPPPLRRFATGAPKSSILLAGRFHARTRLKAAARKAAAEGDTVTLMRFSPSALYHRVRFCAEGYWEQTGGVFGRSVRTQPIFAPTTFPRRVRAEVARQSTVRGLPAAAADKTGA